MTDSIIDRFWSKVAKAGPNDCWEWQGAKSKCYGMFRGTRAHRFAFTLAYGPIPSGTVVCHSCDNPPCCNPSHLFGGTIADNVRDMMAKGRHVRPARDESKVNFVKGSDNHFSKLSEADVLHIRRMKSLGESTIKLARAYDVSDSLIRLIAARKVWKHV